MFNAANNVETSVIHPRQHITEAGFDKVRSHVVSNYRGGWRRTRVKVLFQESFPRHPSSVV